MCKTFVRGILVVVGFLCVLSVQAQTLGRYEGRVIASWADDGRTMILEQPFAFIEQSGKRWDAPKGWRIDGASIPQFAWAALGGPYEGKYRAASVIHDVACDQKKRPWESVHRAFYDAMLASHVDPTKAKIMYAAVFHFGPRWGTRIVKGPPRVFYKKDPGPDRDPVHYPRPEGYVVKVQNTPSDEELDYFNRLKSSIENDNLSRESIEDFEQRHTDFLNLLKK